IERRGRMRSVETGAEASRVPPHDLDAERAVIGAMLVSESAVASVAEQLDAGDFYSEVHRIIYADIVRGKALLRAVIDVGSRITEDAFREPENVSEALDSAEQLIYGVSNKTLREHLAPIKDLAPSTLEMIQRLYEQEGEVTGVETGFEDLDRLTTGFHKSDLVVLAARPAMGKTAMALNAIWHASGEKKMP